MQSQHGGDGSIGKLAGIIPMTSGKDRVTADDIKVRLHQISEIGAIGGASPSQFANQMAGSSYLSTTGGYKDLARQAAVGSAISIGTPGEISTGLDQLHRTTKGSLSDITGAPGSSMTPARYLKSIGANDQMDDLEILQKMFADVERAEAGAAAKGQTLDLTSYMKDKGYQNVHDIGRFSQVYGSRADLNKTLIPMASTLPTLADANQGFEAFKATPGGMSQSAAVTADETKVNQGMGAREYYAALEAKAIQAGLKSGELYGKEETWRGDPAAARIMASMLRDEGRKAGLKWDEPIRGDGDRTPVKDPLSDLTSWDAGQAGGVQLAESYYRRGQQIRKAGGDPLATNSSYYKAAEERAKAAADSQLRSEEILRGISKKLDPPPVATIPPGGKNNGPTL